jgi:hypothetical protein
LWPVFEQIEKYRNQKKLVTRNDTSSYIISIKTMFASQKYKKNLFFNINKCKVLFYRSLLSATVFSILILLASGMNTNYDTANGSTIIIIEKTLLVKHGYGKSFSQS